MLYIYQVGFISVICFVAEILHEWMPFPIPTSVYGLIILFLLLCFKIVKVEQIEEVSNFFMLIMPLLFISPSVSLITSMDAIKGQIIPLIGMLVLSTIAVTAVTGFVAQGIIRLKDKNQNPKDKEQNDKGCEISE
ncbi:MAG TPA: CidA/LrgA family protein [Lachnospiraceae bacterium]|nr:CidA/LrgA family protein [Lachnospiraceae bacterium]